MPDGTTSRRGARAPVRAALFLCIAALAACEPAGRPVWNPPGGGSTEAAAAAEAAPEATGSELYATHCARCHGIEGDGRGTETLETPARDFKAGGFAFGNTPDALFKTISRGVAGKEMPGFQDILDEDERRRLVDHLVTLLPPAEETDARARILEPKGRPAIVRGALHDAGGETALVPRGLMIGYPIGMSFEYDVGRVRLLRAREGAFVDRTDWDGRGGSRLEPLGRPLHEVSGGEPGDTFLRIEGPEARPLPTRFRGSWVRDGLAGIDYEVGDGVRVSEWNEVAALQLGAGFTRVFEIDGLRGRLALVVEGKGDGASWVHGMPEAVIQGLGPPSSTVLGARRWFVRRNASRSFTLYRVVAPANTRLLRDRDGLALLLPEVPDGMTFEDVGVRVTVVPASRWSPELLETLDAEIDS